MVGWVFNGFWTDSVEREKVELEVKCFTEFLSVFSYILHLLGLSFTVD